MATLTADTTGSAYYRSTPTFREELTRVGRGTPMGELLRRYWHAVGVAADASSIPCKVRALGEDLILFRDGKGRAGLVHNRCSHRGTTLYYGKVEERGIRCCYHGWLYDVEGHCLEQPCEPDLGAKTRTRIRQPWYPVEERYGLIFAYMGPPEKQPVLPRYETLENLAADERIETDATSIGSGGAPIMPYNWLQHFENLADPYHVAILHGAFTGTQFTDTTTQMPLDSEFRTTPRGVEARTHRPMGDGRILYRITEALLPCIKAVANPFAPALNEPVTALGWLLPMDDTHCRIYTAGRTKTPGVLYPMTEEMRKVYQAAPRWKDMTEAERRARPGDWEAMVGQGEITLHSEEHLMTSDKGVLMVRRLLKAQLQALADGLDPMGVSRDPEAAPIKLTSGNWTSDGAPTYP